MTVNESHYCFCPAPEPGAAKNESGTKAALLNGAKWAPNENITIRFLDGGTPALREKVMKHAREWTRIAGLSFSFVDAAPSDIRIAFKAGAGSWSFLGTQCRNIPEPQPTMNYGWFTDQTDEAEVRRVVLHEFGHALGLIHEHQNPKEPIQWNRAAVVADLSKPPNNWSEATIENNMFAKYKDVDATAVDVDSIMMYPIPKAWLIQGKPAGFNTELSDTDRRFIAEAYPKM
jgi:hypothetical protein